MNENTIVGRKRKWTSQDDGDDISEELIMLVKPILYGIGLDCNRNNVKKWLEGLVSLSSSNWRFMMFRNFFIWSSSSHYYHNSIDCQLCKYPVSIARIMHVFINQYDIDIHTTDWGNGRSPFSDSLVHAVGPCLVRAFLLYANMNKEDKNGDRAIDVCARFSHDFNITRTIVSRSSNETLNHSSKCYDKPLYSAIYHSSVVTVTVLLESINYESGTGVLLTADMVETAVTRACFGQTFHVGFHRDHFEQRVAIARLVFKKALQINDCAFQVIQQNLSAIISVTALHPLVHSFVGEWIS